MSDASISAFGGLVIAGLFAGNLCAGIVTFSAKTIQSDADVSVRGELVFAQCFNTSQTYQSGATVSVNGVPFRYSGTSIDDWSEERIAFSVTTEKSAVTANVPEDGGLSSSYRAMLGGRYGGNYGADAARHWTVKGLVAGERYLIQAWLQESTYAGKEVEMNVGGGSGYPIAAKYADSESKLGTVVTAELVADGASVSIILRDKRVDESRSYSYLNAVQVRKVKEEREITVDGRQVFVGTVAGNLSLTKLGAGELVLIGTNAYTGDLTIEAGSVRLGSIDDLDGVIYDMDASADGAVATNAAGVVTSWTECAGRTVLDDPVTPLAFSLSRGEPKLTTGHFGGRVSVRVASEATEGQLILNKRNEDLIQPEALIFICHHDNVQVDYPRLWARSNSESGYTGSFICANVVQFGMKGADGRADVFVDGHNRRGDENLYGRDMLIAVTNVASRVSISDQSDQSQVIGGRQNTSSYTFVGSIGEAVALDHAPGDAEMSAVSALLMAKWSLCGDAERPVEYDVIPKSVNLLMKAGTTLDLGGQTQTVASFVGAGTVKNGVLLTRDGQIVQRGGSLMVPAVAGQTYVAESANEQLIVTGEAEDVTISIPAGFLDGVMETQTKLIYCLGTPTFRIEDARVRLVKLDEEGWYGQLGRQVITVAAGAVERHVGTFEPGVSVVKKGEGNLISLGSNQFAGDLEIEEGTFTLGSFDNLDGVICDMDASVEGSLTTNDQGQVLRWYDRIGRVNASGAPLNYQGCAEGVAVRPELTEAFFGGRPAVGFAKEPGEMRALVFGEKNEDAVQPAAIFGVCRHDAYSKPSNPAESYDRLWTGAFPSTDGKATGVNLAVVVKDSVTVGSAAGTTGAFVDLERGNSAPGMFGREMVVSAVGLDARASISDFASSSQALGGGRHYTTAGNSPYYFVGSIGEFVALSRNPTDEERVLLVAQLMSKWAITNVQGVGVTYDALPRAANVTMKVGATLDLGGFSPMVASFVGAGVVTNGILRTQDGLIVQQGGPLTVPAVSGLTYVAESAARPLTLIGEAADVTIRIPAGFADQRGESRHRQIFCLGTPNFVYENPSMSPLKRVGSTGWWYCPTNEGLMLIVH